MSRKAPMDALAASSSGRRSVRLVLVIDVPSLFLYAKVSPARYTFAPEVVGG
jgi:hypothetical protein